MVPRPQPTSRSARWCVEAHWTFLPKQSCSVKSKVKNRNITTWFTKSGMASCHEPVKKEMSSVRACRKTVLPILQLAAASSITRMGSCPAFTLICRSLCLNVSPGRGGWGNFITSWKGKLLRFHYPWALFLAVLKKFVMTQTRLQCVGTMR